MGVEFPRGIPDRRSIIAVGFDETNMAANITADAMSGIGASDEGVFIPFPFSIVGLGARSNADVTQGSVTFEALLDGVATGFTVVLNTTDVRENGSTQAAGLDSADGGRVGLQFTSTADLLPAGSAEFEVWVYVLVDWAAVV